MGIIFLPFAERYARLKGELGHEFTVEHIKKIDQLRFGVQRIRSGIGEDLIALVGIGIGLVFHDARRDGGGFAAQSVAGAVVNPAAVLHQISAQQILIVRGAGVHIRNIGEGIVDPRRFDAQRQYHHLGHSRAGDGRAGRKAACNIGVGDYPKLICRADVIGRPVPRIEPMAEIHRTAYGADQHLYELRGSDLALGMKESVGIAVYHSGGVELCHIVVEPVVLAHIREGQRRVSSAVGSGGFGVYRRGRMAFRERGAAQHCHQQSRRDGEGAYSFVKFHYLPRFNKANLENKTNSLI